MKIGIISDVHSNIYALTSVLRQLTTVDLILCAGDITGYYPFVNEVLEELEYHDTIYIKGNHDAYLCGDEIKDTSPIKYKSFEYTKNHITDTNIFKLGKAPIQIELSLDRFKIAMFHGSPWNILEEYIYPDYINFHKFEKVDADVIILGHTHHPMVKHIGDKLIINPGSCGQPRDYDPRASFSTLDTKTREAKIMRVSYDINKVCQSVKTLGFDHSLCTILKRNRHLG